MEVEKLNGEALGVWVAHGVKSALLAWGVLPGVPGRHSEPLQLLLASLLVALAVNPREDRWPCARSPLGKAPGFPPKSLPLCMQEAKCFLSPGLGEREVWGLPS